MKKRPILFRAEMVRPILNTKPGVWPAEPIDPKQPFKWQTRRTIKLPAPEFEFVLTSRNKTDGKIHKTPWTAREIRNEITCPYGRPGDKALSWRPSIFMPRQASRIDLEIKTIRIEPVQEISDQDVIAEGVAIEWPGPGPEPYKRNLWAVYSHLWNQINRKRAPWCNNPWVWVIEFMRLR